MGAYKCPNCSNEMEAVQEPDISMEVCDNCGGTFLDKGELNNLATGLAGDIEFCSIDDEGHEDLFSKRECPKCNNQVMNKINLLRYSDIIFDHCPECDGFFLDKDEISGMNEELANLSKNQRGEEFRGKIEDHLVRLDKLTEVHMISKSGGLAVQADMFNCLRISVFYNKPLGYGIRVYYEKMSDKFFKAIGLFKKQDVETGNKDLDKYLIIQGNNIEKTKEILLNKDVQKCLMEFIKTKPKIVQRPVSLEILDDRIVCKDGPCADNCSYNVEADPEGIISGMLELVKAIEIASS